ncbi:MAG: hypothetical protein ABFR75_05910 [Acidobacteriota bacterium]
MKVLKNYYRGIKEATLQPKMIFVLWLINFIFSSLIFYISFKAFSGAIGKSGVGEKLLKEFDFNVLFEFLFHDGGFTTIFSVAFVLISVYFLVSILLCGGILFTLTNPRKLNTGENRKQNFTSSFFQGAGEFFGRFFRLSIYSLILWGVFIVFNILFGLLGSLFTAKGDNELLAFYLFWVRLGVGFFLLYLIRMILDYTRIKIVIEDSRHVFRSLFRTIKFVFKRLGKTLALYYLFLITGIILFGIYWILKLIIPSSSLVTIIIIFIVQQVFIAARGWIKIAFQAGQLKFYLSGRSKTDKSL